MALNSQLLAAAFAGDPKAFSLLVAEQAGRLYGIAFKITGDASTAEDVVQETFVRILEAKARLRDEKAAEAWIGRIAGRASIDVLRRREARRRGQARIARMTDHSESGPEEKMIQAEESILVQNALGHLEAETRAAVVLHVIEGNGVREIAECLGTSKSTVTRRIQEGLRQLHKHLKLAGFALPLAISVQEVLRRLPDPSPPATLLRNLAAVRVAPRNVSIRDASPHEKSLPPGLPSRHRLPGALRERRVIVAAAVLLLTAGVALWTLNPFDWGPGREEPRGSVARLSRPSPPTPGPESASPAPALEAPAMPADELPPQVLAAGVVIDAAGEPVEGAAVQVYRDFTRTDVHALIRDWTFIDLLEKALEPPRPIVEGTTNADGEFSLSLPEGEDILVTAFWPRDEAKASARVRSNTSKSMGPFEIRIGFALSVAGNVHDPAGSPVQGATVVALPWPTVYDGTDFTSYNVDDVLQAYMPRAATTDASGQFKITGLLQLHVSSQYALFIHRDGFCSVHLTAPYGPAVDGLEVVLDPSVTIAGKVFFTPGDEPAARARIVAMPVAVREPRWFSLARPDEKGEFSIQAATSGEYKVLAKCPEQIFPRRLLLEPEKVEPPILIDIARGGTSLRGTVRYADSGLPAAEIPLVCRDWAGALFSAEAITDEAGRYEFQGLSWSSRAQVIVKAPGYARKDLTPRCPTQKEPNVTLDIDIIPTCTLRGHVRDRKESPAAGVMVEAFSVVSATTDAAALRWRREALCKEPCMTSGDGAYEIEDYPPQGKVFLWAYSTDLGEAITGPIDLSGGEPRIREMDLILSGGARLEIQVADTVGRPLEGLHAEVACQDFPDLIPDVKNVVWYAQRTSLDLARYRLYTRIQPGNRYGVTGDDGRLTFDDLIPGAHHLSFSGSTRDKRPSDSSWLLKSLLAEPLNAGDPMQVKVALDLSHTLEGRLTDTKGNPLAKHPVYVDCAPPAAEGLKRIAFHGATVTGEDGEFDFPELGPGPYAVTVLDPGRKVARIHERRVLETTASVTLVAPDTPERIEPVSRKRGE